MFLRQVALCDHAVKRPPNIIRSFQNVYVTQNYSYRILSNCSMPSNRSTPPTFYVGGPIQTSLVFIIFENVLCLKKEQGSLLLFHAISILFVV